MEQKVKAIRTQLGQPLNAGALAGAAATVPMTGFMLLMQRVLPSHHRYALPPERITTEFAERAGVDKHMNKSQRVAASLVAHFSYGAGMGSLYTLVEKRIPLPALLKGIIFGIGVWGASYLGLLPALQMKTTASGETAYRNLLMIAAHIIWGAAVGTMVDTLEHVTH